MKKKLMHPTDTLDAIADAITKRRFEYIARDAIRILNIRPMNPSEGEHGMIIDWIEVQFKSSSNN